MTIWSPPQQALAPKRRPGGGFIMQLANIGIPLAASAIGGPIGGLAASAAMGGISKAMEGGSLKEALLSGAIQGGGSALTAGVGGAIGGKVAGEGVKKLGAGAIEKALTDEVAGTAAKSAFGLGANTLAGDAAKKGFGLGMDNMFKTAMKPVGEAAVDTAVDTIGTTAKVRFIEQSQKFAQKGLDTFGEIKAEQAQNIAINEQINANSAIKPVIQDGKFARGKSRFYQPYGG